MERWKSVNQLAIEKVPGVNRVNLLRRINQYEADYNLKLRYHWPRQTQTGEDKQGFLGENHHGGRKTRRSSDVAFINEMIIGFHRLSYDILSITQHDNTDCYDRIVDNITNICTRKYNIPQQVCVLVSNIKKQIKYYILTNKGRSTEYYRHAAHAPIHGSGQGSINAGTEWNFTSIPLMQLMGKKSKDCTIIRPSGKIWKQNIISFVDDTRKYNNKNSVKPTIPENLKLDIKQ